MATVTSPPRSTASRLPDRQTTMPVNSSSSSPPHQRKIKRQSSTPLIAWVQRKFAAAGTVKKVGPEVTRPHATQISTRRLSSETDVRARSPAQGGPRRTKSASRTFKGRTHSGERNPKVVPLRKKIAQGNHSRHVPPALALSAAGNVNTPSSPQIEAYNSDSPPPSPRSGSLSFSLAPDSIWSQSNPPEADDDASIRPLPPTSPPSPAPSRATHHTISTQTSGYQSDPRTFRSGAASTKPTTMLSIDSVPGQMAHIAQAPPSFTSGRSPSLSGAILAGTTTAPSSPSNTRFPNATRHSGGATSQSRDLATPTSLVFSAAAAFANSRRPLATAQIAEDLASDKEDGEKATTQAPGLSHPHPRNNPRPASPPPDNASTLTLASSNFAHHRPTTGGASSVISRFPGSLSHFGGGSLHRVLSGNESAMTGFGLDNLVGFQDPDASVRALRPRSRRDSWGSVGSTETNQTGWSAAVRRLGPGGRKKREDDEDEVNLYAADEEDEESHRAAGEDEVTDKEVDTTPLNEFGETLQPATTIGPSNKSSKVETENDHQPKGPVDDAKEDKGVLINTPPLELEASSLDGVKPKDHSAC